MPQIPDKNEKLPILASGIDREFPNIGFPGIFVVVFVSSFFSVKIVCDLTILLLYGWHAFFYDGLRVTDWKHSVLSNGAPLPWWGAQMIGLPTLPVWVLMIFGIEFVAGRVRTFLALRSCWATVGARLLGATALLGFSFWLYSPPQGYPPIHPIPLSALIGGAVLSWKAVSTAFRKLRAS